MIRNTRANAGVNLPPRRAETVLLSRRRTSGLLAGVGNGVPRGTRHVAREPDNLWGRLLLQAAGSSPAAWFGALEKFPAPAAARPWRERAPLEASWRKKCDLLPPAHPRRGWLVIFTQFLQTQAALAESLQAAGVETFVVNGATPAASSASPSPRSFATVAAHCCSRTAAPRDATSSSATGW